MGWSLQLNLQSLQTVPVPPQPQPSSRVYFNRLTLSAVTAYNVNVYSLSYVETMISAAVRGIINGAAKDLNGVWLLVHSRPPPTPRLPQI